MSERKLKSWQQAGLIDAETAERLRIWEAEHARPIGMWAVAGLGALAIGLGIISVIAANWDAIGGELRLSIHLMLMAGLAAWLWRYLPKAEANDLFSDGALFVATVLGLAFLGHVGQVYQTSSPLWRPLLVWLVISSPLLLLFGRGWPVAALWMAGVLGTAWAHADAYGNLWSWGGGAAPLPYPALYWGLIACPPMAVAALAAGLRGASDRPGFWRLIEQLAVAAILAGVSMLFIVRGLDQRPQDNAGSATIQAMALLGAAAAIFAARQTRSGQATAAILGVAAGLHLGQALLPGAVSGPWVGSVPFVVLWGAVAAGAHHAGWRRIFQLAIGLIALRIVILSFELNDNLLGNGVGLILAGGFAMLIAWGTVQVSRRYAPARVTPHG